MLLGQLSLAEEKGREAAPTALFCDFGRELVQWEEKYLIMGRKDGV